MRPSRNTSLLICNLDATALAHRASRSKRVPRNERSLNAKLQCKVVDGAGCGRSVAARRLRRAGLADGASGGGAVHIYEADTALAGNLGTVILTGAITDHGTDHQGAGGDGINLLKLSKGTFEINVGVVGNELHSLPIDPTTCSSDGSATAPIPIVDGSGTGAYQGISGTFQTRASEAFILPRLPNGQCNTNATKYPGVLIARGAGTVSFK